MLAPPILDPVPSDHSATSSVRFGGAQWRCACPIHRGDGRGRTFSVHLSDNVLGCFDGHCGKLGDAIDLWVAVHQMSLRESALDVRVGSSVNVGNREEARLSDTVEMLATNQPAAFGRAGCAALTALLAEQEQSRHHR